MKLYVYFPFYTGVNYTNILRGAFAPIFLRQKSTSLRCKNKKSANETFKKEAHKMLVKLTPKRHLNG
jgi:hypothetical protein